MVTADSIVPDRVHGERIHVFDKMETSWKESGAAKISIPDYAVARRSRTKLAGASRTYG
jgi:hypothetical protein